MCLILFLVFMLLLVVCLQLVLLLVEMVVMLLLVVSIVLFDEVLVFGLLLDVVELVVDVVLLFVVFVFVVVVDDVCQWIDCVFGDVVQYEVVFIVFQKVVNGGDCVVVVEEVCFLLKIVNGVMIVGLGEFQCNYECILILVVCKVIVVQIFDMVMVNQQGVMIGDGQVWFNGVCLDMVCSCIEVKVVIIQQGSVWLCFCQMVRVLGQCWCGVGVVGLSFWGQFQQFVVVVVFQQLDCVVGFLFYFVDVFIYEEVFGFVCVVVVEGYLYQ